MSVCINVSHGLKPADCHVSLLLFAVIAV